MNEKAIDIFKQLKHLFQGYEFYLVGGPVRDMLLNKEIKDLDFTTNCRPPQIKKILSKFTDVIYTVGEKFGTIGCIKDGLKIEITTFRSETYNGIGRHPQVKFENELIKDLSRRDFTINSIAYDGIEFIDPYNGRDDIEKKLIKFTGDASLRIKDDPLRMLRAIRFATELGFKLADETFEAIKNNAAEFERVAKERIQEEMNKLLISDTPSYGIELLYKTNLYKSFLPLDLLKEEQPEDYFYKDVFEHTLIALDKTPPNLLTRWAILLHDTGKKKTRREINGEIHFYGHEQEGANIAYEVLKNLRYKKDFIKEVCLLIRYHLYAINYGVGDVWSDGAIRRLIRKFDKLLPHFLDLIKADITSSRHYKVKEILARVADLERRIEEIKKKEEIEKIKPLLNGYEIMQLRNIPPSPLVGKIKNYIFQKQLELGDKYTKEEAIKDALEFKNE